MNVPCIDTVNSNHASKVYMAFGESIYCRALLFILFHEYGERYAAAVRALMVLKIF